MKSVLEGWRMLFSIAALMMVVSLQQGKLALSINWYQINMGRHELLSTVKTTNTYVMQKSYDVRTVLWSLDVYFGGVLDAV